MTESSETRNGVPGTHRVLLVEDDEPTRERLVRALAEDPGIELVADVGSVGEASAVLDAHEIDTLLTDLDLPDGNGLELIRRVAEAPGMRSLVITVFGDERHVIEAIVAGAAGYLLKDGSPDDLARAVRDVERGGSPISPSIARYLLKHFNPPSEKDPPGEALVERATGPRVTEREREVLRLIAKGFSYAEIAGLLELSVHTVTSHVKNIYRKLAVSSRGEAVYEAIQLGLISMERGS